MKCETFITTGGYLPCLHCGKVINLGEEIHLCNAPDKEWLNKQKVARLILPNGKCWDFKEHKKTGEGK